MDQFLRGGRKRCNPQNHREIFLSQEASRATQSGQGYPDQSAQVRPEVQGVLPWLLTAEGRECCNKEASEMKEGLKGFQGQGLESLHYLSPLVTNSSFPL